MKKYLRPAACILLSLLLALTLCSCENEKKTGDGFEDIEDKELLEAADALCRKYFEEQGLHGMSVGILSGGKRTYLNYGTRDEEGTPADENTIYEIASLTKTFTGTVFGWCINKGIVGKDDPVKDYFDCKVPDYRGQADMTLLHLATHTAGLPREAVNFPNSMNPYGDYTEEMALEYLQKGILTTEPGKEYKYSNFGAALLGYILGKANGKPYSELVREVVLDPLEMDSTDIYLDEERHKNKAKPYLANGIAAKEWDFDFMQACGGLKSTTRDMVRYLAACLGDIDPGEELAEAIKLAKQPFYMGSSEVGLFWHMAHYDGVSAYAHDGLVGGYCSYIAFSPQNDAAVIILCNNGASVTPLGIDVIKELSKHR